MATVTVTGVAQWMTVRALKDMLSLLAVVFTSVKQNCVAPSTAEAEYISASEATAQAIWLRFVLEDFGEFQAEATPLHCDNTAAIAITKNPVFHQKTKHIDRRYHFITDAL